MRFWFFSCVLLAVLFTGCGASQDAVDLSVCRTRVAVPTSTPAVVTIVETVTVETIREIPVTIEVEKVVEVTREVTRLVEVERIVTATPTNTPEPTSTPLPTNTPQAPPPVVQSSGTSKASLLTAMNTAREDIGSYGYIIDQAMNYGYIDCWDVVDTYNRVASAPEFGSLSADLQQAYNSYRAAIGIIRDDGYDLVGLCQDLMSGKRDQPISKFVWSRARTSVNDALNVLEPAIRSLE